MRDRRRHDLPRVPRAAASSRWPARRRTSGLLDVRVHDLRDWTHDRHRTVDDTPYGGGAGMVMKPEPWGEALDALLARGGRGRRGRAHPGGRAVHPGARRRAGRPSSGWCSPAAATRASTSGCWTTPPTGCEVREVSRRRLRAQRRRGRRPGDRRGGRAAAARVHGQPRVAGRGVARRRRPAGVPRLHQARQLARPRRARRCCSPATTPASPPGATTSPYAAPRERRPDLPTRAGSRPWRTPCSRSQPPPGRRRRAAHPAARLLGAGGAGQPRRRTIPP